MKYDRLKLIALIDEIEAQRKADHEARYAPRLKAWQDAVDAYRRDHAPELAKQLRALAKKASDDQLLTASQINGFLDLSNGGKGSHCFEGVRDPAAPRDRFAWLRERPKRDAYEPDRDLLTLRSILVGATNDDFVSSSELERFGFKGSVFIKAARGGQ